MIYIFLVHCGSLRQTAQIISMSEECLRTGDKASVHFKFIKHPEYIKEGQRLVFREGRTKAVGNVVRTIPHAVATTAGGRSKTSSKMHNTATTTSEENANGAENGDKAENQPQKASKRNRGKRRSYGQGTKSTGAPATSVTNEN